VVTVTAVAIFLKNSINLYLTQYDILRQINRN